MAIYTYNIIFSSKRLSEDKGYYDLYLSFKKGDGSWGKAIHLGKNFGEGVKMCASLSPDGKYIFYMLNMDIYWVSAEIIEKLGPN